LPSVVIPNLAVVSHASVVEMGLFTDDINLVEEFSRRCIFQPLGADPRRHGVVICMPSGHGQDDVIVETRASGIGRCFAERLGVPWVCRADSPTLALLALGLHTGIVLDIGLGVTRATPVLRGRTLVQAEALEFVGAANCTNYLLQVFHRRGSALGLNMPEGMSGFQVMMLVKNTKEEHGYVAQSRDVAAMADEAVPLKALSQAMGQPVSLPGKELAAVGEMFFDPQRITGPQHSYFGPSAPAPMLGLAKLVHQSMEKAKDKLLCSEEDMAAMLAGIIVTGGTARLPGLAQRLQKEVDKELQHPRMVATVRHTQAELAWSGGSLLAVTCGRPSEISLLTGDATWHEDDSPCWSMFAAASDLPSLGHSTSSSKKSTHLLGTPTS